MGHYQKMEESVSLLIFSHHDLLPVAFLSITLNDGMCHKNKILCRVLDDAV